MKLSFVSKYASIDAFDDIELPKLTIITGINGSGKSQLLKAIIGSNRINYQQPPTDYINVSINDDVVDKKDIYGPVSDFGISGYGFNPSANTIKIDIISKNIGNIKQNIKKKFLTWISMMPLNSIVLKNINLLLFWKKLMFYH